MDFGKHSEVLESAARAPHGKHVEGPKARFAVSLQHFGGGKLRVYKEGKILFQGSRQGLIEWLSEQQRLLDAMSKV